MGVGNVGLSLNKKNDKQNTYLSRDGGLNWIEIMHGSNIYEIGDHGGLLVVASNVEKTS